MSGMEPLLVMSMVATAAGAGLSAAGSIAAGEAQSRQLRAQAANEAKIRNWQAKQMEVQGQEEQALAQRKGLELERQKKFALSKLQSRSAASGFTATDPTTLNLAGDIEEYGTYQQQMAQYGGDVKRRDMELGAAGNRYSALAGTALANSAASDYRTLGYMNAGATIAQGAGSIFAKYAPTPSTLSNVYHPGFGNVPTYIPSSGPKYY